MVSSSNRESYSASEKLEMIEFAMETSQGKAATKFGVHKSMISRWIRSLDKILAAKPTTRRIGSGRKPWKHSASSDGCSDRHWVATESNAMTRAGLMARRRRQSKSRRDHSSEEEEEDDQDDEMTTYEETEDDYDDDHDLDEDCRDSGVGTGGNDADGDHQDIDSRSTAHAQVHVHVHAGNLAHSGGMSGENCDVGRRGIQCNTLHSRSSSSWPLMESHPPLPVRSLTQRSRKDSGHSELTDSAAQATHPVPLLQASTPVCTLDTIARSTSTASDASAHSLWLHGVRRSATFHPSLSERLTNTSLTPNITSTGLYISVDNAAATTATTTATGTTTATAIAIKANPDSRPNTTVQPNHFDDSEDDNDKVQIEDYDHDHDHDTNLFALGETHLEELLFPQDLAGSATAIHPHPLFGGLHAMV